MFESYFVDIKKNYLYPNPISTYRYILEWLILILFPYTDVWP